MWPDEKARIIARYDERLQRLGSGFAALNSGTEERRAMRFQVLADIGIRSGDSVLDLGCGFGDLHAWLAGRGLDVAYTGYDINPTLVAAARERHPGARFEVKDVLEEDFPSFDWIVSTSCFNLRMADDGNYPFIERLLTVCHAHATRGVAVDFLTSYVDFPTAEGFHYEPERLFAMAKRLTKRVTLRHDYPLFEFAVYLYPDFTGWSAPR